MKLPRRHFLHLALGAAALPVVSRTALAQVYPTRTITVIVPFAAGGATDVTARIMADHMSRSSDSNFVLRMLSEQAARLGPHAPCVPAPMATRS
jgi:tripartite-type tricarboxylate transporter receptor subunit TctC